MATISYTEGHTPSGMRVIRVKLDGRLVGSIHMDKRGYYYVPKGSETGGEVFQTLHECKQSLR